MDSVHDLDGDVSAEVPRWLGNTPIGGRSHHALFCPPGSEAAYRVLAPPHSSVEAWCGIVGEDEPASAEFVLSVRQAGASEDISRRLRIGPGEAGGRRWRKLVLDVGNDRAHHIELTLKTIVSPSPDAARAIWGEPMLAWRRPFAEIEPLLRDAALQVLRGRMLSAARTLHGRLSGSSYPTLYQFWLSRHARSTEALDKLREQSALLQYRPLVSVVTPVYNTDARWLRACVESVKRQAYPYWELCLADDGSTREETRAILREYQGDPRIKVETLPRNVGIAAASNAALALAEGEFVAFLDHDDEISPDALFEVAAHLNDHPDTDFMYSDEDKLELDGTRTVPYFKPAWSPEHFLTNMYTCHLMVVRRSLIESVGGFRPGFEGAQDYDLVLRLIERTARIGHVPKVLYHWRRIPESTAGREDAKPFANDAGRKALQDYVDRNRLDAEVVPGDFRYLYRVRFAVRGEPLVSIILPAMPGITASDVPVRVCEATVRTIAERTAYQHIEVLLPIVDDRSLEAATQLLRGLPYRPVRVSHDQVARAGHANLAAAVANGDHLLLMDWGMHAAERQWLNALLEYSQQRAIGAVGAKLLYPDGSLKHIGIVLGVNGVAARPFDRHPRSSLGYWGTAIAARNYSAVSGLCMMTRREVFQEVGGLREELGSLADVDYCLSVTDAGYRIVFTPYAELTHDDPQPAPRGALLDEDAARLRSRWGGRLSRDPFYNVNLSRTSPDYEPDLSSLPDARVWRFDKIAAGRLRP
jgi:O-antigen biosynthesis protein